MIIYQLTYRRPKSILISNIIDEVSSPTKYEPTQRSYTEYYRGSSYTNYRYCSEYKCYD
jgi:hypothetical protein